MMAMYESEPVSLKLWYNTVELDCSVARCWNEVAACDLLPKKDPVRNQLWVQKLSTGPSKKVGVPAGVTELRFLAETDEVKALL